MYRIRVVVHYYVAWQGGRSILGMCLLSLSGAVLLLFEMTSIAIIYYWRHNATRKENSSDCCFGSSLARFRFARSAESIFFTNSGAAHLKSVDGW